MTALRWGILATGGIAHAFTADLRTAGLTVTAVGSRSAERAAAFAAEFDIPRAHGSYEDLAAEPDVDIVYIATPHPQHLDPALLMIAAGKHVLVEKAFTANAAEAARIRDAAAAAGVLAMEAMWTRYLPHMVRLREIVASGVLGSVRGLIADHTQRLPDDPAHRLNNLELGGGALLDLGIYPISFAWDLFGAPERVQALATLKDTGADADVAVQMQFGGGAIASTFSSSMARGRNQAIVLGSDASIHVDGVFYAGTSFRVIASDGDVLEEYASDFPGRGMQFQALAAERLVAAGDLQGDVLSIDETVAIMGTLDEIRRQIGVVYPADARG
ncbi:Gfo/Idh/MocA family protein [Microbacterium gorillae]|uniref:Gfo/Idh/MocA family protein n=1 Tax=Microbacterium gorillae TaxID=1231063 RepID=UPI0005910E6E|nr:Gfo/Idh/MocA family oxidoreductase [Microbacterium gorillae]